MIPKKSAQDPLAETKAIAAQLGSEPSADVDERIEGKSITPKLAKPYLAVSPHLKKGGTATAKNRLAAIKQAVKKRAGATKPKKR